MVAGTLTKETAQRAGVIFLTMESIFRPPALGHFKITFNSIVKGVLPSCKVGRLFKSKENHKKLYMRRLS